MKNNQLRNVVATILAAGAIGGLAGCGGGGGGGGSSAGPGTSTYVGTITGFGSVYVNGVRFNTDSSSFDADDNQNGSQGDLRIGMCVKVKGHVNDDGVNGVAFSVEYDDEVEGPIASISDNGNSKTLTVLGLTVTVDANTHFDDSDPNFNYNTIAANDIVEVSGFRDGDTVRATYIEKKGTYDSSNPGNTTVELKGTVSNHNAGSSSFNIGGVTVSYDGNTDMDDLGQALADGMLVEVKGTLTSLTAIAATEIESEHEEMENESGHVNLQGIVSGCAGSPCTSFSVNGIAVDAASAMLEPANLSITNEMIVEVEGSLNGSSLVATKVEQEDSL
jgi:hypothetical protein